MITIELKDKNVLIIGGSSGIGKGIADLFLGAGAGVAVADIAFDQKVDQKSERLVHLRLDVTNQSDVAQAVKTATDLLGSIHILVNSAGISTMDYAVDIKEEDWDRVMDVNSKGTFLVTQAVARQMIERGIEGRIINIASQAGKNGYRCMGNYCSSKHAVLGFTKVMAIELAPKQILVNAICPGIVETSMKHRERIDGAKLRNMTPEQIYEEDCSQVPLGRTALPSDVANVALFLASPLSSYMTGQAINVTGGMTMN
ncbi:MULTISPECIES: SDR family NAD(P)-dependent oxidoreductase [Bacillus]|uniref:Oxidoreductase n=2 Tax=Bacillus TaxID=1386 RepID=A0A0M3RAE1_9BACI|nr:MULTISPECIES: SDR family NAD(P)-dependent oxidoreductase [Bacillus]ALC83016.1 oxidoreductase [Bacillus gobiensis]MBP1082040.1 NAD(P)-dependent dehydrogenase (short-subunit alcohol dehydrogenase family) [Bacillus capparidis]MED1096669.1 SDR family NAD(P)-dependent oxidoreductase [Bacillus capparidis]